MVAAPRRVEDLLARRAVAVSLVFESAATMPRPCQDVAEPIRADPESREWLRGLRADGAGARRRPSARCTRSCCGAARFEVAPPPRRAAAPARRRARRPRHAGRRRRADGDPATSSDDFRGDSRFTTWAYKFALLEAAVKLRRRAWQGREVPLEPEAWALFADRRAHAARGRRDSRAARACGAAIARRPDARTSARCSSRSRSTACRSTSSPSGSSTTRGALYKTLHDARAQAARPPRGARARPRTRLESESHDATANLDTTPARRLLGPAGPRSTARSASSSSTATSSSSSPARDADARRPRACGRTSTAAPPAARITPACTPSSAAAPGRGDGLLAGSIYTRTPLTAVRRRRSASSPSPRTVEVAESRASPRSTSHSGNRLSSSSSATRPSRRARLAPRQKCSP